MTYDLNGNLTSDGVNTYEWDARNQLSTINRGATATFQYDALGRRSSKTVTGAVTGFLYDGINVVQELSGGTPSANLLTGLGVDEIFTRTDSAGTQHFLTDALGSTLEVRDSSGTLLTQYTYEPFGKTTVSGGDRGSSYQYTGRENDGTGDLPLGLYFYRARYYSPGFQRFISEDPIGFRGGINFFAYVENSPLNFTDPYGLLQVCCRPSMVPRACHCFLKLPNGNTFGGYNDGLPDNDPTGPLNPRKNDPSDQSPKNKPTCNDVPTSKCEESKIPPQFPPAGDPSSQLPQNLLYGVPLGSSGVTNTSNTVPAEALRNAGIPYRFPPCALGAENPLLPIRWVPVYRVLRIILRR